MLPPMPPNPPGPPDDPRYVGLAPGAATALVLIEHDIARRPVESWYALRSNGELIGSWVPVAGIVAEAALREAGKACVLLASLCDAMHKNLAV